MERSSLEIKVQQYVINYGPETLFLWLEHFEKVINSRDYPLFRQLEREACKSCDITMADMRMFSNTPCTNARRIISFICIHQLKFKVPTIAILLGVSDRTINYYVKEAADWVEQPRLNREFTEAFNKVIEKFKT
jgi:hypothetical protein